MQEFTGGLQVVKILVSVIRSFNQRNSVWSSLVLRTSPDGCLCLLKQEHWISIAWSIVVELQYRWEIELSDE